MWFVLYRIYKNSSEEKFNETAGYICGDIDPSFDYWSAIKFFDSEEASLKFVMKQIRQNVDDIYFELDREHNKLDKENPYKFFVGKYCNDLNWNSLSFHDMKLLWKDYKELWSEEYIGISIGECVI